MTTIYEHNIYHPLYSEFSSIWVLIRDVLAGKKQIDSKETTYLPKPNGYSDDRYTSYQTRAVLYNATARTLDGYLGAVFRKPTLVELPEKLEYLKEDTDGEGNNLTQFSKLITKDTIAMGREGILVDYPQASGIETLKEETESHMKARLLAYTPESIVNWTTCRKGSKTVLTSVLLREETQLTDSHSFSTDSISSYRRLALDGDGYYFQTRLVPTEGVDSKGRKICYLSEEETVEPVLPGGERMDYIPFVFVGSETFTPAPDNPPLYSLAQVNLAHYRNSADWQQAVFMIGQPTPWISGLDNTFIEENRGQLVIGSSAAWLLPEGAVAGMLESKTNKQMITESMDKLEQEMIGLGARIVQDNTARGSESTESVLLRRSGEASQLACIADNVSEAMTQCFKWAGAWMDCSQEELDSIKFKLNKDFFGGILSHQQIKALVEAWQSDAISHEVLLDNLRKGEIVPELTTNEEVKEQIDSSPSGLQTL